MRKERQCAKSQRWNTLALSSHIIDGSLSALYVTWWSDLLPENKCSEFCCFGSLILTGIFLTWWSDLFFKNKCSEFFLLQFTQFDRDACDTMIRFFCSKLNFQSLVVSVYISWQGYLWHDDQDFLSEINVQSFVVCFATSSREEYQRVFQWGLHFFTSKHQYWKRPFKA